jgi:glucose-6-phosphate isomerase
VRDLGLVERIWAKDASAWGPGEDDPAERLGWLTLPGSMRAEIPRLEALAEDVTDEGFTTVALLGMGGSSLAPEVFQRVLGSASGHPELVVMDSTHPDQVRAARDRLDLDRTLFVVSSKSGGTVETMSLYRYFRAQIDDGAHFIAITDPDTSLTELARNEGFRDTFENPPDIGGRFSALSLFGLVPAALIGVDIDTLLARADVMASRCREPDADNPGFTLGRDIAERAMTGRDKLTFQISDGINAFGDWVEQLLAESTGKHDKGIAPVFGEPPVEPAAYGRDRVFVHLRLLGDDTHDGFCEMLRDEGHPVLVVDAGEPIDIGAEMFRWEFATAVAGSLLEINAFDQPDVEAAKKAGREVLEGTDEVVFPDGDPERFFSEATSGELAALLAFAPMTDDHHAVIKNLRWKLASKGVATLGGFGPRYLHSTGQLLKGGPPGVRALVVLEEPTEDVSIPGSEHGFARLVTAQALGDARAMEAAGRSVVTCKWSTLAAWASS